MMPNIIILFFLLLSFVDAAPSKKVQAPVSKVDVASMKHAKLMTTQYFNGTLQFHEQSRIASQSSGVVTKLFFQETDSVKKGDLLLSIDDSVLQATYHSQKRQLQEAKLKLDFASLEELRNKKLLEKKGISKQVYEKFKYTKLQLLELYESLKHEVQAQKLTLAKKHLYAPFDGVMASREVQQGEWLNSGASIGLLLNPKKIDLLFYLPQKYIATVHKDMLFNVTINDKEYQAKVMGRLLNGDTQTRSFGLLLRLQASDEATFFQGMQVVLELTQNRSSKHFIVPRDAIIQKYDQSMIYVVEDEKAKAYIVDIISYEGNDVAISSEKLKEGMKVVVKGNERLYPNAKVSVK